MKEGWKYLPFEKSIVKVKKQKSIKSKDYKEEGQYPVVSQESSLISGYFDDASILYQHDTPVVIFGDHTQNVKYVDFDFIVGADGVHILSPIAEITPKYFYYQLKSIKLRNLGYARHYKLLKQESIGYPPLPEQERIVSLLDAEFAKIDAIKANAEKQLQDAKALFQSALQDLSSPKEGWGENSLGEIATDMYRGNGITRAQVTKDGISCVRYGEIYTTYDYHFNICVSHTDETNIQSRKYFEYGDILFAITGESVEDIGKSVAYLGHERCLAGGDIVVMKHTLNPKFLGYVLSAPYVIKQKGFGKTKLKVVHTNVPSLKSIIISYPPSLSDQQQIAEQLDKLSAKIHALQSNFDTTVTLCNDLKQSILKDIFS